MSQEIFEQRRGSLRISTDSKLIDVAAVHAFIDEAYRGRELGTWLLETVLADPHLLSVRRWVLATRDAHGLYEKFGFEPLRAPERWMERRDAL